MKPTTEVVLGIRSVGDKEANHIIESMPVSEAIKKIAMWTLESTMHQRFQFVFARSPEDALIGLGLTQKVKDQKRLDKAVEITNFLDELFDAPAGGPIVESDQETLELKHAAVGLPMRRSHEQ